MLRRFVHSIPQKTLTGEHNSCYEQRIHCTTIPQRQVRVSPEPQRFRIQGCGVVPSNSIERNWEESRDQSRFGWPFGSFGRGAGGGTETRIAAGANEA